MRITPTRVVYRITPSLPKFTATTVPEFRPYQPTPRALVVNRDLYQSFVDKLDKTLDRDFGHGITGRKVIGLIQQALQER